MMSEKKNYFLVLNLFGMKEEYYNSAKESRFDKEPAKQSHLQYGYVS